MDAIEAALQKWAKSPEGQKALNGKVIEMYRSGNFQGMGGGSTRPPMFYADELIRLLQIEIARHGHEFGDYLYVDEARSGWNDQLGKYELIVDFKEEFLSRPSLEPDRFPEGAYNIVALLNKGYHAKGAVYGEWHGMETWSKENRPAEEYIQDAVRQFHALYGAEAVVNIDLIYGPNYSGGYYWPSF